MKENQAYKFGQKKQFFILSTIVGGKGILGRFEWLLGLVLMTIL